MSTNAPSADEDPSTDRGAAESDDPAALAEQVEDLAEHVDDLAERVEDLERKVSEPGAPVGDDARKMTIVATKGTLDMAYPPLVLATTAAAFGWDVVVFHTFWGLAVLHEEHSEELKLSAVGNPNLPMPNAVAALPGMDALATRVMERRIDDNGTASVEELVALSIESGVEHQACQMTVDLLGYDEDDFYDGVEAGVGAATAVEHMADSDVQLLV